MGARIEAPDRAETVDVNPGDETKEDTGPNWDLRLLMHGCGESNKRESNLLKRRVTAFRYIWVESKTYSVPACRFTRCFDSRRSSDFLTRLEYAAGGDCRSFPRFTLLCNHIRTDTDTHSFIRLPQTTRTTCKSQPLQPPRINLPFLNMRGEHCVAGASILSAIAVILLIFANIGQVQPGAFTNAIYFVEVDVKA